MPPSEVVVSGQEALEEARVPSPAAIPAAAAAVTAPRHPEQSLASSQAAAAPDYTAQTQPPGPGACLHGRGHSPLSRPARVSRAFGLFWSQPGGCCLLPGASSRGPPAEQTDARSRAVNGRSAQPEHARKVVAPREAPAPHTLSVALQAGGGMGPGKALPMGVDRGAGAGHKPPRPPPLLSSLALSSLAPGPEPAILRHSYSLSGSREDQGDPCAWG